MPKQKGFSLIELLIVVAIILIIAAIAIPNLLRSRMAANEASAIGSVRTLNTAEITYSTAYPSLGYAVGLANLGGTAAQCVTQSSANACIIDPVLAAGAKSGYLLAADGATSAGTTIMTTYLVTAIPATVGTTGMRGFCSTQTAVIYFNTDGTLAASGAACVALTVPQ
jgi:type IV pilus assembly protein PilA